MIFGSYIQEERRKLSGLSIEDICQKGMLSMSVSLYKITEAGNTSFNITRIPDLIRVFKNSDLLFDRLTKFISGQNIADNSMSNQNMSAQDAIASLADIDNEFKAFYERIIPYFKFDEGSKKQKEFIQSVAHQEIRYFLQNNKYPMTSSETFDSDLVIKIKKVPSLSINLLLDFVGSFAQIIPLHFDKIAAGWETKNYKEFVTADGLYLNPELIVKKENLMKFNYDYLDQSNFTALRFLFKTNENVDKLKEKFIQNLNKCRKEKKLGELDKSYFSRIHFKSLSAEKEREAIKLLIDPLISKNSLQAFWVFGTKTVKIGFVGVSENDVNIGYNLSYEDSVKRSEIFDSIFNNS